MNTLECIKNRKSVRKFTNQNLTDEQIDNLMKAAMASPSAKNMQPWQFYVITSDNVKSQIKDVMPYGKYDCPVIIIPAIDLSITGNEHNFKLATCDLAAATENILLAACDMGLGSVWCAVYPSVERTEGITKVLNLENQIPYSAIYIGYEEGFVEPKNKYNKERIHYIK